MFALCCSLVFAQNEVFSCGALVPDESFSRLSSSQQNINYSGSIDPAYLASFLPISFDIYYWVFNRTDGSHEHGPLNETDVLENMERINFLFRPMGICFVLKGFQFINNDAYYDNVNYGQIPYYIPNCFNVYVPNTLTAGNGATNFGSNKLAINAVNFKGRWHIKEGNAQAHELAHDFGLMHPWGAANGTVTTEEHVTRDPQSQNYNALTKADLVADTPAMVSFYNEANLFGVGIGNIINIDNCTYTGTLGDNLGVPFDLTPTDVGNVMAYTWSPCINNFTVGQGIRMREWIANPANINMASMSAKRLETRSVDLYVKDSDEDIGEEPNVINPNTWSSPSIWVRNQYDEFSEHQNPEYDPIQPNYIKVRVGDRGCSTSSGNDQLTVYWSKATTSLSWDYQWIGNSFNNGPLIGNIIGTVTIPPIESYKEIILSIPWTTMPNPNDYNNITPYPWHFCLLSRIVSSDDSMTFPETEMLYSNVTNNNNIAQKNVTIVDIVPNTVGTPIGGVVMVGNIYDEPREYSLEFFPENQEVGKKIFEEAEVSVELDETLMNAWTAGGKIGSDIRLEENNKIIITGLNAKLDNLKLDSKKQGTLNLEFNFLVKEITIKDHFTYHIMQKDKVSGKVIGGETYEIYKHTRNLFHADAGDIKYTDKNVPLILSAEDINEPATYNWYDSDDNLVFEGINFTVSTEATRKYKLEVIALSDGYKDYSEVEVKIKPNSIFSIHPNPTTSHSTFIYKINTGNTAYLSVTPLYTSSGTSQNYILDVNETERVIDFSNYSTGTYLITLIANGSVCDSKYIIKQ